MGLYLKKSFSIGPLRINLSKSGLGVSVGEKGFRVSCGPKGNSINVGRKGLYYRKSFSDKWLWFLLMLMVAVVYWLWSNGLLFKIMGR